MRRKNAITSNETIGREIPTVCVCVCVKHIIVHTGHGALLSITLQAIPIKMSPTHIQFDLRDLLAPPPPPQLPAQWQSWL